MQGEVTKSMPERDAAELEKAGLNQPAIGNRLAFDVEQRQKGPRAVNVEAV